MNVQAVRIVEEELFVGNKESFPTTFFHLEQEEQREYELFLREHDKIKQDLRFYQGQNIKERQLLEEQLSTLFLSIINPYFEPSGIQATRSFATYGDKKQVLVSTPPYALFQEKEQFAIGFKVEYIFHAEPGRISATSNLKFIQLNEELHHRTRRVIYDLLHRYLLEEQSDGITKPLLKWRGDGLYFASTDFALPLILYVRKMLGALGPEVIRDLEILLEELDRVYDHEGRRAELKRQIFKEAYEKRIEQESINSGLKEWKKDEKTTT
ncbi:hypothetical protein HY483_02260 [Candidatus Woesearchaeota archaeon]|nr:hypothetical protein [Candidatus Woesearchaeota archaeon]